VQSLAHKIDYLSAAKYVLPRRLTAWPTALPARKLRRETKYAFIIAKSKAASEIENGIAIQRVRGIAEYRAIKLRMAYKVTIMWRV